MMNTLSSTRAYWLILNSFLNQNRYIIKYKDKAELFNNFFADQCSIINNSSVLPSVLLKRTEHVISYINFNMDNIVKIIQKLDPNNTHGHYMISIYMLKICNSSIYKALQLISQSFIENERFPSE